MEEVKCCTRCGDVISVGCNADYYSHIRILYCDRCRPIAYAEKHAEAQKRYRKKRTVRRDAVDEMYRAQREATKLKETYLDVLGDRVEELQRKLEALCNG